MPHHCVGVEALERAFYRVFCGSLPLILPVPPTSVTGPYGVLCGTEEKARAFGLKQRFCSAPTVAFTKKYIFC